MRRADTPAPPHTLFAVTAPGLEPFTWQELHQLGLLADLTPGSATPSPDREVQQSGEGVGGEAYAGGVEFRGSLRDLYRVNLHLRTASRVLVHLGQFYAAAFSELRKKASRLPWENFVTPGQPVALRVTCRKSKLYHSDAVAERVTGAIADRLGREAPVAAKLGDETESPSAQLIVVRLVRDACTIRLDSSGALLHQRGYRLATAKAPLRETLAAGMLLASGWDTAQPLLDPFCGSGTIAIEAALLARKIAPGRARRFAFMDWPSFDAALWQALVGEADKAQTTASPPPLLASDRDAGAVESAKANAVRAGVADLIQFSRRAISAIEPPASFGFAQDGWVVTNPPYGVRVGERKDLRNLYARFGRVLQAKFPGWHVAMLSGSAQLQRSVGLDFDDGIPLVNGGLRVRLVKGRVPRE